MEEVLVANMRFMMGRESGLLCFLRGVRWLAGGVIIRRRRVMGGNLFFMKSVVQAAGSVWRSAGMGLSQRRMGRFILTGNSAEGVESAWMGVCGMRGSCAGEAILSGSWRRSF